MALLNNLSKPKHLIPSHWCSAWIAGDIMMVGGAAEGNKARAAGHTNSPSRWTQGHHHQQGCESPSVSFRIRAESVVIMGSCPVTWTKGNVRKYTCYNVYACFWDNGYFVQNTQLLHIQTPLHAWERCRNTGYHHPQSEIYTLSLQLPPAVTGNPSLADFEGIQESAFAFLKWSIPEKLLPPGARTETVQR